MTGEYYRDRPLTVNQGAGQSAIIDLLFSDVSRNAREIVSMYVNERMVHDLDQQAWNIEGDQHASSFGSIVLESWNGVMTKTGGYQVSVTFQFSSGDPIVIERMLDKYLQTFSEHINDTILEYRERTGKRFQFSGRLESWDVAVNY